MAKYFFTSAGVYLSWTGIESLTPADVYPSLTGVKQVIAAPLPSGVDPASVSLNLGTGAITYATNSPVIAQQTTAAVANGLGIALDLIESLVQIVSKVADGSGTLSTNEQGMVTKLKTDFVPLTTVHTATDLGATRAKLSDLKSAIAAIPAPTTTTISGTIL